jgi:hypothetical protein
MPKKNIQYYKKRGGNNPYTVKDPDQANQPWLNKWTEIEKQRTKENNETLTNIRNSNAFLIFVAVMVVCAIIGWIVYHR